MRENFEFFEAPTQVAFYDDFGEKTWTGGIAYHGEIICLECGCIIDLNELLDEWEEVGGEFPIRILSWISLSEECVGDIKNEN